jgi:hypothetical protein
MTFQGLRQAVKPVDRQPPLPLFQLINLPLAGANPIRQLLEA